MTNTQKQNSPLKKGAIKVNQPRKALEALLQTGIEVSLGRNTYSKEGYLFHEVYSFCDTSKYIRKYKRTIVTYLPKQKCFIVKEGDKDFCSGRGKKWIEEGEYFEKERVPAGNITKVKSSIGRKTLLALGGKVKTAIKDFSRFNSGDYKAVTEEVAKLIILDRTKKRKRKEIRSSDLRYSPCREDKLNATLEFLAQYPNDWRTKDGIKGGVHKIPMVENDNGYNIRNLYFCREFDVVIDNYREGRANLYGSKANIEKLVRLIKHENRGVYGPGL